MALGAGQGRGTHPRAGLAARAHASTARDVAIVIKNRGSWHNLFAQRSEAEREKQATSPCFVRCRWGKLLPAMWGRLCTLDHVRYV